MLEIQIRALSSIGVLLLLIFAVIWFKRIGLLKEEHGSLCSALVVRVTLPALILMTLIHADFDWAYGKMNLLLIAATFICLVLGWLIARAFNLDKPTTAAVILTTGFSSSSVLGVPLITGLYPENKQVIADTVVLSTLGMGPMFITMGTMIVQYYGTHGLTRRQRQREMMSFFYSPIFIAILVGIVLRSLTIHENSLVHSVIDGLRLVSAGNTLMVLLALGLFVRLEDFRKIAALGLCVALVNLLLMPLLTTVPAHWLDLEHWKIEVLALEAAMPSITISVALCAAYGANARVASKLVLVTLTGSILTIPVVFLLAGVI